MKFIVFACLISVSLASLVTYRKKKGERLVLDLGPSIRTWTRSRNNGPNEFIKYCSPTERNVRCAQFVSEEGRVIQPASKAHVFENGTLVIDNITASDEGYYFSEDEEEKIHQTDDGWIEMTPRTTISVEVD